MQGSHLYPFHILINLIHCCAQNNKFYKQCLGNAFIGLSYDVFFLESVAQYGASHVKIHNTKLPNKYSPQG